VTTRGESFGERKVAKRGNKIENKIKTENEIKS
jgi:hypothetical protein